MSPDDAASLRQHAAAIFDAMPEADPMTTLYWTRRAALDFAIRSTTGFQSAAEILARAEAFLAFLKGT